MMLDLYEFKRHHALRGKRPRLVHHLRISPELAAHQGLKALSNVLADVLGLNGAALDKAEHGKLPARNIIGVYQNHKNSPLSPGGFRPLFY